MPKKNKKNKSLFEAEISIGRINLSQIALFAKHLSVMLKSGLVITEALDIIQDSARGKFKKIITKVLKSIKSGNSFFQSLALHPRVFSGFFINTVYAGESSGTLSENLENIAEHLKKERELISKIKGAMIYPIIVLIAAFILGIAMAFLVLPKITPLFEGLKIDLPATTRALIWFSHFIQDYGLAVFLSSIVFLAFLFWLLKQKFIKPVIHWLFLKIPIIRNMIRNANLARICRTLGTLLKSGLSIDEAMEVTRDAISNFYYRRALENICRRISKGTKLAENFMQFEELFPIMATRMIKVGEASGKLDEVLIYLSEYYEAEVDNNTKSLSAAIEPILLIVIGLVVGFLALSIITPIYDITGEVKR